MRAYEFLAGGLATVVLACGTGETPRTADTTPATDSMATAPPLGVAPRFTNLTCEPAVIRSGDVLTMRMTVPHGSTFMAIAPDGTQYLVVFHGEGRADRAKRKSLAPPDAFAGTTELNVDPRLFTAGPWVSGRDTNELLFRVPGVYRLIVGSDLETDGPSYAECLVRYAP
jgi:hypothetical protein